MEHFEIIKFIASFNSVAAAVVVIFAICGGFVILGKFLGLDVFKRSDVFRAFCVAAVVALAAEATFFNFQYYLKFFAGPELYTMDVAKDNPNVWRTSDKTLAEISNTDRAFEVTFKNLDRKITSLYTDLNYINSDMAQITVKWSDKEGSHEFKKIFYKGLPYDNYTPFQSLGNVSRLSIAFNGSVSIAQIAINKQIPFYFSGLRLLVFSFLLFAAFMLINKNLRVKTAYYLFSLKFNPSDLKQNLIYAFFVVLLIIFSWICLYTTTFTKSALGHPPHQKYNKYLVDAFLKGRTWLDYGDPKKLLEAEDIYNNQWRAANLQVNVDWMWDWEWYKGKYYSYNGPVPAAILYVPYKMITGNYLSNHAGIFLFSAAAIILLAMLWRFCVKKYMPDSKFSFYLISFLTLFFASGLFSVLNFPRFYSIVQAAGFMFITAGILLLLKSVDGEKIKYFKLFFACLCLALVVGCRPNLVFVSLLVPVVLWRYKSWKLFAFIMIPYMMVAIPLCMYNYARFDSIFQFGQKYCLTNTNLTATGLLNPIGLFFRWLVSFIINIFGTNQYSLIFPYVETFPRTSGDTILGFLLPGEAYSGIINFPIVFCLFYLFKNKIKEFNMLSAFLIIAASIIAVSSFTQLNGYSVRYVLDFAAFIILPSLFCAYYWTSDTKSALSENVRLKVVYVALSISVFVGLCLFVTGGLNHTQLRDPALYRYLEYSLSIIRRF
ncbi:MAG: hypothetical protein LBH98_03895 [Chitinispirillales bacterium]|nr:hypothetical protein [Chitinispirillales bacterium]